MTVPPRVRLVRGAYYWQPTPAVKRLGFSAEALGRDLIAAFAKANQLNAQVEAERRSEVGSSIRPASVSALIKLYKGDAGYQQLAPKTRTDYDNILARIEAIEGNTP